MSCIHSLKHVKRLCTSALAHYYPVLFLITKKQKSKYSQISAFGMAA